MKRCLKALGLIFVLIASSKNVGAADGLAVQTKFTTIYYSNPSQIVNFAWRISGKRLELQTSKSLAMFRIDEITLKVQDILGIYPDAFHATITLKTPCQRDEVATYSHQRRDIAVCLNKITDGAIAHELAHAIISSYFDPPPDQKVQEILAQYVDQHLWSEV